MERKEGLRFVVGWVNLLPTMATNGVAPSCQINPLSPSLVIYSIACQTFPTKKLQKNMLCEKTHTKQIMFQKKRMEIRSIHQDWPMT